MLEDDLRRRKLKVAGQCFNRRPCILSCQLSPPDLLEESIRCLDTKDVRGNEVVLRFQKPARLLGILLRDSPLHDHVGIDDEPAQRSRSSRISSTLSDF